MQIGTTIYSGLKSMRGSCSIVGLIMCSLLCLSCSSTRYTYGIPSSEYMGRTNTELLRELGRGKYLHEPTDKAQPIARVYETSLGAWVLEFKNDRVVRSLSYPGRPASNALATYVVTECKTGKAGEIGKVTKIK